MNLVMFDIDGTLTKTVDIDENNFVKAVNDVLNIYDIDTDLTTYKYITDEGIAAEIIERHTGRPATNKELLDIRIYFVSLLKEKASANQAFFQPVRGARELLTELQENPDIAVSIATGGWKESAIMKTQAIGLDLQNIPVATSNDAVSREDIRKLSEKKAKNINNINKFESVVYVGDGVWDLDTSNSLGYHFIGIGKGERASLLKEKGAVHIIPDFSKPEDFFDILESIGVVNTY